MRLGIRKRDDLPEMTWQLVLVTALAAVGTACIGGRLIAAPMPGLITAFPFFALSAAAYSALILLWRKPAALAVTPLTALCLFLSDCGYFCTAAVSLALLFLSCLHAVSLLSGETRFVRVTSVSCGIAAVLAICAVIRITMHFPSLADLSDAAVSALEELLEQASAAGTVQFVPGAAEGMVYSLLLSSPALLGVIAEMLAALMLFLSHAFLTLMECTAYFQTAADGGITTPRSFGGISLIVLFLTICTSPQDNPLLYSVLSNCLLVLSLPCAYVGVRELSGRMRRKFDEASMRIHYDGENHKNSLLPTTFLFLIAFLLMGLSNALLFSSALGAFYILRAKKA